MLFGAVSCRAGAPGATTRPRRAEGATGRHRERSEPTRLHEAAPRRPSPRPTGHTYRLLPRHRRRGGHPGTGWPGPGNPRHGASHGLLWRQTHPPLRVRLLTSPSGSSLLGCYPGTVCAAVTLEPASRGWKRPAVARNHPGTVMRLLPWNRRLSAVTLGTVGAAVTPGTGLARSGATSGTPRPRGCLKRPSGATSTSHCFGERRRGDFV